MSLAFFHIILNPGMSFSIFMPKNGASGKFGKRGVEHGPDFSMERSELERSGGAVESAVTTHRKRIDKIDAAIEGIDRFISSMGRASSKEARVEVAKTLRRALLGSKNEPPVLLKARKSLLVAISELERMGSEHSVIQLERAHQLLVRVNRLRFRGINDEISRISSRIDSFERGWGELQTEMASSKKTHREDAERTHRKFLEWLDVRNAVIDFFAGELNDFIRPFLSPEEFDAALNGLSNLREKVVRAQASFSRPEQ